MMNKAFISIVIIIFNSIILSIICLNAIIKIFKSKNYYNCKKLIPLELSILLTSIITVLFSGCIVSIDNDIGEAIIFLMFGVILLLIPILIFILINILIIYIVMKLKKYNLRQNIISFKKHYKTIVLLNVVTTFFGISALYIIYNYNYNNRQVNAITYYENKYNIKSDIVGQEKIYENDHTIGTSISGILYQLENGDKIFYDFFEKKYYDNRQDKDIQMCIKNYYQTLLDNIIKEIKAENILSQYAKDSDGIELYQDTINAEDLFHDYKYYDAEELYFNNYYDLKSNNEGEIMKQIFSSSELHTPSTDIIIICDKNGNWENVMEKYIEFFADIDIDFRLYDFSYESHTYFHSDAFARYLKVDGKMEKRIDY